MNHSKNLLQEVAFTFALAFLYISYHNFGENSRGFPKNERKYHSRLVRVVFFTDFQAKKPHIFLSRTFLNPTNISSNSFLFCFFDFFSALFFQKSIRLVSFKESLKIIFLSPKKTFFYPLFSPPFRFFLKKTNMGIPCPR